MTEIDSLDNSPRGCYASNKHFAHFFGIDRSRASQIISGLNKKGLIKVTEIKAKGNPKQTVERQIRVVHKLNRGIEHPKAGIENIPNRVIQESNPETIAAAPKERIPYQEIIGYLNEKTGKQYSSKAAANQRLIRARWHEAHSLDDFKQVISFKAAQWCNDDKMSVYLRPATLFGNKFDEYLNQMPSPQEFSEPPHQESGYSAQFVRIVKNLYLNRDKDVVATAAELSDGSSANEITPAIVLEVLKQGGVELA
ncbi:conserved phage C-terminal domain-containing protein [Lactobacillus selangorensis]|nr:conserved phage C-terminal domain-containing protein [Lactobacillus selangorensis]